MNPVAILNAMPGAVSQGLIWGIMAIGIYITYRILDVSDLTVDGTMCTGGAVFIVATVNGCSIPVALLLAFVAGMLAGLVTGLFHTVCGIPAILSGILTQLALYSVNLRIMGKANHPINANKYDLLVSSRNVKALTVENPVLVVSIFVILTIAVLYWFFGTELGCSLRATGSNPNMSRAQGINTNVTKVLGLMIANGLVALSSALLSQYQGFADVNMGRGAIVIGLAAVIIGEVFFGKIFINFALKLFGVVLGSIIYYVVYQLVIGLGMSGDDMKLITALTVAVFLTIPHMKAKHHHKKMKKGGAANA
ncbi:MAG: ABC transporter permease [Oscillospiraceae bacterium]|nr:ABC transporter permease [Oscillospiraceae bacterium]